MSEMQRYDVYYDDDYDAPRMQRTEVGSYVLYSDACARVAQLEKALRELANTADNYYCEAMHGANLSPCLGWEAKAKCGEFGQAEYDAHKKMHELFGKHFGIHEAVKKMRAALGEGGDNGR